jgi:hypothetical protein
METFTQMIERHAKEVASFQILCKHRETELREYFWAPGHSGGFVTVCKNCEKILSK